MPARDDNSLEGSSQPTLDLRSPEPSRLPPWVFPLVRALDDAVTIPFTSFRIGADAVLGLVFPVVGDALTAITGFAIFFVAFRTGVPRVVLARMMMNLAADALLGSIPFVGDVFDVAFKANRANLALLERHATGPQRPPTLSDYVIVGLGIGIALLVVLLPLLVVGVVVEAFRRH